MLKHVAVDNSWITVVNEIPKCCPNPKALETSAALRMKRLILGHQKAALDHSPCPVNRGESSESMAFHGPNPS